MKPKTTLRTASLRRKTNETDITLELTLDGAGNYDLELPVPFLKHMLELFAKHGAFDLKLIGQGDIEVDDHHLVEDVGIVLGQALAEAVGDKRGITRYGHAWVPMDEALVLCALDLSGRAYFASDLALKSGRVGKFDVQLVHDFFEAFAVNAKLNLHLCQLRGRNRHHIIEAAFKATARALRLAVARDPHTSGVPSTKGTLTT